eukprot:GDKI01027643.1.p1 GENE.GDKI01027643.1~~GDKI01027643.1.p1  ORF type:complete len:338 (-),score=80.03 GDKI01027643.1:190-1203(-)
MELIKKSNSRLHIAASGVHCSDWRETVALLQHMSADNHTAGITWPADLALVRELKRHGVALDVAVDARTQVSNPPPSGSREPSPSPSLPPSPVLLCGVKSLHVTVYSVRESHTTIHNPLPPDIRLPDLTKITGFLRRNFCVDLLDFTANLRAPDSLSDQSVDSAVSESGDGNSLPLGGFLAGLTQGKTIASLLMKQFEVERSEQLKWAFGLVPGLAAAVTHMVVRVDGLNDGDTVKLSALCDVADGLSGVKTVSVFPMEQSETDVSGDEAEGECQWDLLAQVLCRLQGLEKVELQDDCSETFKQRLETVIRDNNLESRVHVCMVSAQSLHAMVYGSD